MMLLSFTGNSDIPNSSSLLGSSFPRLFRHSSQIAEDLVLAPDFYEWPAWGKREILSLLWLWISALTEFSIPTHLTRCLGPLYAYLDPLPAISSPARQGKVLKVFPGNSPYSPPSPTVSSREQPNRLLLITCVPNGKAVLCPGPLTFF